MNLQHLRRQGLQIAGAAFAATMALCASALASPAHAQVAANTATNPTSTALQTASVWPTLLALIAVIGAIVIFGWVMKKLNPMSAQSGKLLSVVSQLPVGPKERVVVVAFQSKWLVLGVTPNNIALISTHDAVDSAETTPPNANIGAPFQALLDRALNRRGVEK